MSAAAVVAVERFAAIRRRDARKLAAHEAAVARNANAGVTYTSKMLAASRVAQATAHDLAAAHFDDDVQQQYIRANAQRVAAFARVVEDEEEYSPLSAARDAEAAAARAELKKPRYQRKDLRTSEELQSHLRHLDMSSSLVKKCGRRRLEHNERRPPCQHSPAYITPLLPRQGDRPRASATASRMERARARRDDARLGDREEHREG